MVYNKMFFGEDDVPCKRTARQACRALLTQSEEGANVEDLIDTATMIRLKGRDLFFLLGRALFIT